MLADAKYWLDKRKSDAITDSLKEALSEGGWTASTINKKIDTLCKDESYLLNLITEINKTADKQIDSLRTIISYRKTQMNI